MLAGGCLRPEGHGGSDFRRLRDGLRDVDASSFIRIRLEILQNQPRLDLVDAAL